MKVYALYQGWVQTEIDGIQINGNNYSASQILAMEAKLAERDEADNALVDKYRDPNTGSFAFPGDVAKIIRRFEAIIEEQERDLDQARCHIFAAMEAGY